MSLAREPEVIDQRVPPQNVELEMCVLGAIMIEPREAYAIAADFLSRDSFYLDGHGLIFELMGELKAQGIPPDSVAVLDALRSRGLLERVGGSGVLMGMLNSVPTAASVEYHSRLVAEKATRRSVLRVCAHVMAAAYKQELPVDELLALGQDSLASLSGSAQRNELAHVSAPLREYWDEIAERGQQAQALLAAGKPERSAPLGLSTGLWNLDELTGGIKEGEFWVVAAGTSIGKTMFALSLLRQICIRDGKPGLMLSLEMRAKRLARRLLLSGCWVDGQGPQGITSNALDRGLLSEAQWELVGKAYAKLAAAPIHLLDSRDSSPAALGAAIRGLRPAPAIAVVDYLQLMRARGLGPGANRTQEVSSISRDLKNIADSTGVPVVALSQFSREFNKRTDRRPRLEDLKESSSIEQDADVVLMLHRECAYDGIPRQAFVARDLEINVAKNRDGDTRVVNAFAMLETGRVFPVRRNNKAQEAKNAE